LANPKNKFPKQYEKAFERTYSKAITRLGRLAIPEIKRAYENSATITEFKLAINRLYDIQIDKIAAKAVQKPITKEVAGVSKWATSTIKKSIKVLRGINKASAIEAIDIASNSELYKNFVGNTIKKNILLVESLGSEYIDGISQAAIDTYTKGGSIKELSQTLLEHTDGNIKKAKFWARDQVGNAFAEFTKEQQSSAGFANYIWRTVGDNAVRETHSELEGRVFSWTRGAAYTGLLTKPGAAHPGEDYNCRCYPEPTREEVTG